MDSINQIKLNLEKAKAQRLSQESTEPKTRHTIYLGDRTIQQLGQAPIENGVVLNNQSIKIGDPMLPLAKGNVLRRVDNTNGGALLGSAYRDAVENDFDINGDRRNRELSRNGSDEPSDPSSPSTGLNYPVYPPPFGCVPPPQQCFWSTNPIAPDGFQGYGDVVLNENALPLYLYCQNGIQPPDDLGCTFLSKNKWGCSGGVCSPDPNGLYNSQAECEAARLSRYIVEIQGTFLNNSGVFQSGGFASKIVNESGLAFTTDGIAAYSTSGEPAYWYKIGTERFTEAGWRLGAVSVTRYDPIFVCPI